jgi:hypothetical protein
MTGAPLEAAGAMIASRYRVEETLGRGGMAEVYRVWDERAGRHVALKRSWSRDPQRLPRHAALLEHEYHTLAQLAHPHIIEVFDYGRDQSGPYYTMELLEGEDLGNVERLGWKETCAVLRDIASSLAILHSRGLIHRDVALRNIHRQANGRAKLFDFGAMTSMGVGKDLVGTPPFMAPEVLQLQALDARVDLYALGAVGYRLLTGRHAFPARRASDLRDAWRSKPQPPSTVDPSIPAELNGLVLRMLSLDRAGRPQNAAEVIETLTTIADLPREDVAEISRAYLTTPTLVGRDRALLEVRRRMLSLVRGDGGVLLVEGGAGSGRSRLLDACALEAKLLAVLVVRADLRDAGRDWGVARAIGTQLLEMFPGHAMEAARLSRDVISHVVEDLQADEYQTATAYEPDRSLIIRELRDWILSFTKVQRMILVVDDADQIDGPSAALLSALANKVERNALMLAVAVERDTEHSASAPLRLLRDLATPIEVEDMLPHDTEGLFRSLFGDAPNVDTCAARVHGLSNGNPRTTIAFAQHLVDTGRAQYEGGSWVLPPALDETDLPHTLTASLAARMQKLSPDARELASALALADGSALPLTSYPALTTHRDSKRTFRALDELVAARILTADMERYSFVQRGFLAVLEDSMPKAQRKHAHFRLARELATVDSDPLRRAEHLLAAGSDAQAIELLCKLDLAVHLPPVSLLELAVERAEGLSLPAATVHRLRMALIINAPFALDSESLRRVLPVVLRQLERDSGLQRYRELEHLPAGERLAQAFALTQQAYLATPEHDRVYSVIEAIRELAHLHGAVVTMSTATFDHEVLALLPPLEPLFPLSPTLPIIALLSDAAKDWLVGRISRARAIYERVLTRVSEPDRAGFDEAQYNRVRYGLEHVLGMLDARWGAEAAEDRASLLEERSEMRVNAWRIRALMHLSRGNALEGRRCSRRAELLEAQNGPKERYGSSTVGVMANVYARLGDPTGLKSQLQPLAALAAKHPGWRPTHLLARASYSWLLGDLPGALATIEEALELGGPTRWSFFGVAAGVRVRLLYQLGRHAEAVSAGRAYLELCREQELEATVLLMDTAVVLSLSGEHDEAQRALEALFVQAEAGKAKGLAMGCVYEVGAWLALRRRDTVAFESCRQSCTREYEISRNPVLGARVSALIEQARELGMYASDAALPLPPSILPVEITEYDTIHSRIVECIDAADRARCSLTLLLQSTPSCTGYLYGTQPDRTLKLLASLPDAPTDPGLGSWIERCANGWTDRSDLDEVTVSESASGEETLSSDVGTVEEISAAHYVDPDYRPYTALPLWDSRGAARTLIGVFVLEVRPSERVNLPPALVAAIARELLDHGDAYGWPEG